jgi:lambda repressor-like predicted transcriptional regulator
MFDIETKNRFFELRAKGWSLARIAAKINVAQRTLVNWNRQHAQELRRLRAAELEALHERIFATHQQEARRMATLLETVEEKLAARALQYEDTRSLFRMAVALRGEIRQQRREVDLMLEEGPIDPETPSVPVAPLPAAEPVAVASTPADSSLPQEPPQESVPVDPSCPEPAPDEAAPTAAPDGRISQPLEGC